MAALEKIMKDTPKQKTTSQKSSISNNKYIRSDLDDLEKLCEGLNKQIKTDEDMERENRMIQRDKKRYESQNIFKKSQASDIAEAEKEAELDKKFEVFAKTAIDPEANSKLRTPKKEETENKENKATID